MINNEFSKLLKNVIKTDDKFYAEKAYVTKVNTSEGTIDVKLLNDTEIFGVKLVLFEGNDKVQVYYPKVDSIVGISWFNKTEAFVSIMSYVNEVNITSVQGGSVTVNDKITIQNDIENIKDVLSDLCDALTRLTVGTAVGPSGVPINSAEIVAIKTRIGNLFGGGSGSTGSSGTF